MSQNEAKQLREENSQLRRKLHEWACDECGDRKSTCTKGDVSLCNKCAFGESP